MAGDRDIQINLLNYKLAPERKRQQKRFIYLSYLVIGLLLVTTLFSMYMVKRSHLAAAIKTNQQLKLEIKNRDYVAKAQQNDVRLKDAISQRQNMVQEIEKSKLYYGSVFRDYDQMKLPGVFITSMEIKAGTADFVGYITDSSDLGDVVAWFQKSKCFGEINQLSSQLNPDNGELQFNLSVSWEGEHR